MKIIFFIFFILISIKKSSQFTFATYYHDDMVLQRSPYRSIIWGYGTLNSIVSLHLLGKNYSTKVYSAESYKAPIWQLQLDPIDISYSINLEFTESNSFKKLYLKNILFGDIWLCGGQSNMQMTLNDTFNGSQEIENGFLYKDKIRLFSVELVSGSSDKPETDLIKIKENWSIPSKKSLGGAAWQYFSAVCWHFGKKLTEKIDHPIGLIVSCWGGTEIERWCPPEVVDKCKVVEYKNSSLWNSMIHPFLNFPIYGVVWYQAETNTLINPDFYSCNFENMIKSWREHWYERTNKSTNPNFPFGFVQIANYYTQKDLIDIWPRMRWHQTMDIGYAPNERLKNVFMASAIDLVDDNSSQPFHPRYKEDVGQRLGLGAFNLAYNMTDIEYIPPVVESVKFNKQIEVKFKAEFQPIEFIVLNQNGFDVCCDSEECLKDDKNNWIPLTDFRVQNETILLNSSEKCAKAEYVRYLWRHRPCDFKACPLYSKRTNLPVYPFISRIEYF